MAKKIAIFGSFLATAIIFGYVEFLLPVNIGIPGAKLGLANIIAVIILYNANFKTSLLINIGRILICGILFGSVLSTFYALLGGVSAVIVMALLKYNAKCFSVGGVSVAGAVTHNIFQVLGASFVINTAVFYYLPFLALVGTFTGTLIGIISHFVNKRIAPLHIF